MIKIKSESAKDSPSNNINTQGKYTGQFLATELKKRIIDIGPIKRLTKRDRVLLWLFIAAAYDRKPTRFDAEIIGDHCLPSTISAIQDLEGIAVSRQFTRRSTRFGTLVRCAEYWLHGQALEKAQRLCERRLSSESLGAV